jgi:hypothetical protein
MIFVPETRPAVDFRRIRWEEPPCPLCGGERQTPVVEAPDALSGLRFAVVRCDECGIWFTSPRPDAATIGQFYRDGAPSPPDCGGAKVHLVDVVEHAHDPLALLTHVRRRLGPGGRLTMTAPNADGLGSRWFSPAWTGLDLPRHLTHFGPQSLRRILEKAGFRDVTVREMPWPECLWSSARLAGKRPLWQQPLRRKSLAVIVATTLSGAGFGDRLTATAMAG